MAQHGDRSAGLDTLHREAAALQLQLARERVADRRRASELRALEVRILRIGAELEAAVGETPPRP